MWFAEEKGEATGACKVGDTPWNKEKEIENVRMLAYGMGLFVVMVVVLYHNTPSSFIIPWGTNKSLTLVYHIDKNQHFQV